MAKMMTKAEALAIDNLAIILAARQNGLAVRPEDLLINYAELDHELTTREDEMASRSGSRIQENILAWLSGIEKPEDVTEKGLQIGRILAEETLAHVKSVWSYGGQTADRILEDMGLSSSGSQAFAEEDLTDDDAYEWYEQYTRDLGKSGQSALFMQMQPYILEALDQGRVRLDLANKLADEFARYGPVRAEIIARTESNKAFNWGRRWRFDKSEALAGYRYSAILDSRTTEMCKGLHDHSWQIGEPDLDNYTPPNHYRCRSILVPISKYQDHTFEAPADGWEEDLPAGERKVLERFKDSTWYPTRKNVNKGATPAVPAPAPAKPKPAPKKKGSAPAPAKKKAQAPASGELSPAAKDILGQGKTAALNQMDDFLQKNAANLRKYPNHPAFAGTQQTIDDIKSGKYDGKAFSISYGNRSGYTVKVYDRLDQTDVFYRVSKSVKAADRDQMLEDIRKVAGDPRYAGIKIEIIPVNKSSAASYNAGTDVMEYTMAARGVQTLHHEIGHRIHNTKALYSSTAWADTLGKHGINITDDKWSKWQQVTESFWEPRRTGSGEKLLPDDMAKRWSYPINAPYYYSKGTKANFHKEMFAESTSVFMEGDPAEIAKVRRTYPGLMEFMETEVFKR